MFGSPKKDINPTFDLQNQQQMSSSLLRYRLAPSSLYGEVCENFVPVRPSSPETDSMFARFLSPDLRDEDPEKSADGRAEQSSDFSDPPPQMLFHSHPQPSVADASNLIRQNSSPAGFFDSGYCLMRGRQISFSSRQSSLSQISEMGSEGMSSESPEESSNGRCFVPGFPVWEDSLLSDGLSGFKRAGESVNLNISQHQNGEAKNHHIPALTHQFSLPKTSSEMSAIEKILQFQDSVPCKIRAKRGCATHPRSIAERVRRTRISERMRKLQELVPNMDKQTNTADMLDLAVDYIKDLQCQVKTLTDNRVACSCSATKETTYLNQIS